MTAYKLRIVRYKSQETIFMVPEQLDIIFTNYLAEVNRHKKGDFAAFKFAFSHLVIEQETCKML